MKKLKPIEGWVAINPRNLELYNGGTLNSVMVFGDFGATPAFWSAIPVRIIPGHKPKAIVVPKAKRSER